MPNLPIRIAEPRVADNRGSVLSAAARFSLAAPAKINLFLHVTGVGMTDTICLRAWSSSLKPEIVWLLRRLKIFPLPSRVLLRRGFPMAARTTLVLRAASALQHAGDDKNRGAYRARKKPAGVFGDRWWISRCSGSVARLVCPLEY